MDKNYQELKNVFEKMNNEIAALKQKISDAARPYLEKMLQHYFDENEEIKEIFWTQYTPYFNDGEACEFSVNEVCFILHADEEPCDYEGTYLWRKETLEKHGKDDPILEAYGQQRYLELREVRNELNKSISYIEDEVLQVLFGDHVRISANKNDEGKVKIEIDEYNHD